MKDDGHGHDTCLCRGLSGEYGLLYRNARCMQGMPSAARDSCSEYVDDRLGTAIKRADSPGPGTKSFTSHRVPVGKAARDWKID